jgi:hypothetical protein
MKALITIMLVVGFVGVASAYDLGNQAPVKPVVTYPDNIPNAERQGGDTIANATVIPGLPYYDTGTTAGYTDDYSGSCYFAGGAPDVVYMFVPAANMALDIDLCGSTYDTGLYVYDAGLNEIACNDDFCGLQSTVHNVPFVAGATYYIIIDGYGNAYGAYQITIGPCCPPPCPLDCPTGGYPEGEPALVPDYVDHYNGGCNTPGYPFQDLFPPIYVFCGVSGWYTYQGSQYRDTDWFILPVGWLGTTEITADAEYATYIFELSPQDCASVGVVQQATAGPCAEAYMTIAGSPGAPVWFWVGPTVFAPPPGGLSSYDYIVWFDYDIVANESTTWSTVKALFE